MFQQSVDRSRGTAKSDLWLFIALVAGFFAIGSVVVYLGKLFSSSIPRYVFIGIVLAALYLIYRLRLIGYRYTIFYKEAEPVYDPRFDDMIMHEDYQYPVGTIVFERIVSAKGNILLTIDKKDIIALVAPGEAFSPEGAVAHSADYSCTKIEKAHSLYFMRSGELCRVLFAPDAEFLNCFKQMNEAPGNAASAPNEEGGDE